MNLQLRERPAAGEPQGTLVLLHGREGRQHDLFPLLDALDPERRLRGVTPRGPLALPPGGAHWYRLAGIPTPDPETFRSSLALLSDLLDGLQRPLVLGGFSQGAVISWALGLGRGPASRPAAIVALSGFMPAGRGPRARPLRPRRLPRRYRPRRLRPGHPGRVRTRGAVAAGACRRNVLHREYPLPHTIDPGYVPELADFVRGATAADATT